MDVLIRLPEGFTVAQLLRMAQAVNCKVLPQFRPGKPPLYELQPLGALATKAERHG